MWNHRGSTFIEALFAFMLITSVLVTYLSLFESVYLKNNQIKNECLILMKKESDVIFQEEFVDVIEMVLH